MTELALYETAKAALAQAVSFDEVKRIRSEAAQAKAYAKIAGDRQVMADWHEIVARAERQLGVHLRAAKLSGELSQGGRPSNSNLDEPETGAHAEPVFDRTSFTLAELGVSKKLSSRAQALALLSDADFKSTVTDARTRILSTDAPVVSSKLIKTTAASKPSKPIALEARRFHQFAFSVLALSVASDRVGSKAIQFLARECGLLSAGEEDIDFTPEAAVAMGAIAAVALKALDEDEKLAAERAPYYGSAVAPKETASDEGESNFCPSARGHTSPDNRDGALAADLGTSQCEDGASPAPLPSFRHSKHTAEPILRARYEHEPTEALAAELGVGVNTLRTWAFRLGLTSKQRISAMATERNTRRAAE